MDSSLILSQSEYERLLEEIKQLQARLIELTALRDDFIYHVCPSLRAIYEENIGSLERELVAAKLYLREKQRILELLQAELNRRKKPSIEQAEKQAQKERQKYEKDLKKKAEEAKQFKDYWENTSKWSKHDRDEKQKRNHSGTEEREQDRHQGFERQRSEHQEKIGTDESGYGQEPEDAAQQTITPAAELKSLYRKIVKRLHPDVHPDPTPREKELLNQAHEAYKLGDLEKMRGIWEEIIGMDPLEDRFEDSEEGRRQLRELLKVLQLRCHVLEREILKVRSEFPYTMKAFLEDEKAVEERRRELKKQIEGVREMDRQLAEHIERLKKQMGGEQGV